MLSLKTNKHNYVLNKLTACVMDTTFEVEDYFINIKDIDSDFTNVIGYYSVGNYTYRFTKFDMTSISKSSNEVSYELEEGESFIVDGFRILTTHNRFEYNGELNVFDLDDRVVHVFNMKVVNSIMELTIEVYQTQDDSFFIRSNTNSSKYIEVTELFEHFDFDEFRFIVNGETRNLYINSLVLQVKTHEAFTSIVSFVNMGSQIDLSLLIDEGVDVLEWLGILEDGILLDDTYPYPIFENVITNNKVYMIDLSYEWGHFCTMSFSLLLQFLGKIIL